MSSPSETLFCSICNQPVTVDMVFCRACGYPVKPEDAPPPRGHLEAQKRSPLSGETVPPASHPHRTPARPNAPAPSAIRYTPGGEPIVKDKTALYVPTIHSDNSASDRAHALFTKQASRPLIWPVLFTVVIIGFLGAVGYLGYNMAKVQFYGVEESVEVLELAKSSVAVSDAVNLSQQLAMVMQNATENGPSWPIVVKPQERILLYPIYSRAAGSYTTEQVDLRLSPGSTVTGAIKPFNYGFCIIVANGGTVAIIDETGYRPGWGRCSLKTGVASP